MKKCLCVLLPLMLFCVFLSGCTASEPNLPANYITRLEPTPEQQEMINLLSDDTEFLFFEYQTEDAFDHVEFWVEVYAYGKLAEQPAMIRAFTNGEPKQGKFSVMIKKDPGYQWTISMTGADGDPSGNRPTVNTSAVLNTDYSGMAVATDQTFEPFAIEDGKETVLYAAEFSSGETLHSYVLQEYVNNPEYLKSDDYIHLIKCKFTNKESREQ